MATEYEQAVALLARATVCDVCKTEPATVYGYSPSGEARLVCVDCPVRDGGVDMIGALAIRDAQTVVAVHDVAQLRAEMGAAAVARVEARVGPHASPAKAIAAQDAAAEAERRASVALARALRIIHRALEGQS